MLQYTYYVFDVSDLMPRGDNRRAMRIAQTYKDVARLHMEGHNQQAIADQLGKDQGNVSRMLKRLRGDLHKEAVKDMGEVRAVQNARLEGILTEYWEMFRNGNMEKPETAVAGALKTVSEISRLLGVNINPAQVINQKVTTETVDPDTLASKLASVFSDGDVVDGEIVQPDNAASIASQPAQIERATPHHDAQMDDCVDDAEEAREAADMEPEVHQADGVDVVVEAPRPASAEHWATMLGTEARRAEEQERAAALADQLAARYAS